MISSQEWWAQIKNDSKRFNDWLVKQHRGEVTAASRIDSFAARLAPNARYKRILEVIADQERTHAGWVLELLKSRGVMPDIRKAEERYWKEVLPTEEVSFEEVAAIGAHAEAMRLERIKAIAADASAPTDIRETFQRILKDEVFHERAFRDMAGSEAMAKVAPSHSRGRKILGLEA